MCGRFTLKTPPAEWAQLLLPIIGENLLGKALASYTADDWRPRYNIAPTQQVVAFAMDKDDQVQAERFRWGLIPPWAGEVNIGSRMINARAETVAEKRSFSGPLKSQRCLVLADGYYEWQKQSGNQKQPYWIAPNEGTLMLLAGLWETNRKATGKPLRSCTLITTSANAALQEIHDRMPVMLRGQAAVRWLSPNCDVEEAQSYLGSADDAVLRAMPISTVVNNVRNDSPDCLTPAE